MSARDHADLIAFAAIAEERSFRRAATRLNLTPSTLSHALRGLEDRLGVRLLNRTTRAVSLTEAGAALLAEIAPAFRAVDAAVEAVNAFRDRPHGTVSLNVPRLAAALLLAPKLGAFADAYPDITLEVTVNDAFVDILRSGHDAGIRLGESVDQDMVAIRVSESLRGALVASPDYFRRRPPPRTPRGLQDHLCINRRHIGSGALHRWEFAKGDETLSVLGSGPLILNSDDLMLAAAIQGAGIAFLSESDVVADLAAGRLVRALEDWCPPISGFYLYHPRNRHPSASMRALVSMLTKN